MDGWDVIVIGGGSAGSTTAGLLAKAGKKVLVLERAAFPRFHVGESLIPFGNPVLRELGVWDRLVAEGYTEKLGTEFVLSNSAGMRRFWFRDNLDTVYSKTFYNAGSR
jgi:2-polyprenyl-6-methoxyphenol hydroxylase-like FAD-dependent oxidoreductase